MSCLIIMTIETKPD